MVAIAIATSFLWVLGIVGIATQPADYNAYLILAGAVVTVMYVATHKIEISNGKIAFYRFFRKQAEAEVKDVRLIKARVGKPPLLIGLAFVTRGGRTRIAELVPGNYRKEDIARLVDALGQSTPR